MLRQHPLPCQTVRHPCFDCLHPCKEYICPILRDASHKKARSTGLVRTRIPNDHESCLHHRTRQCKLRFAAERASLEFCHFLNPSLVLVILLCDLTGLVPLPYAGRVCFALIYPQGGFGPKSKRLKSITMMLNFLFVMFSPPISSSRVCVRARRATKSGDTPNKALTRSARFFRQGGVLVSPSARGSAAHRRCISAAAPGGTQSRGSPCIR